MDDGYLVPVLVEDKDLSDMPVPSNIDYVLDQIFYAWVSKPRPMLKFEDFIK